MDQGLPVWDWGWGAAWLCSQLSSLVCEPLPTPINKQAAQEAMKSPFSFFFFTKDPHPYSLNNLCGCHMVSHQPRAAVPRSVTSCYIQGQPAISSPRAGAGGQDGGSRDGSGDENGLRFVPGGLEVAVRFAAFIPLPCLGQAGESPPGTVGPPITSAMGKLWEDQTTCI